MIDRKDIENVRNIMDKTRRIVVTEEDQKKYENLIKGFDDVAKRYLQEVHTYVRIQ